MMKTTYPFWITGLLYARWLSPVQNERPARNLPVAGEKVYLGQPDSIAIRPGLNRVEIKCWTSDPKAGKMKIYWNNGADSITGIFLPQPTRVPCFKLKTLRRKIRSSGWWFTTSIGKTHPYRSTLWRSIRRQLLARLFPRQIRYAQYLRQDPSTGWGKPTEKCVASVITYTICPGRR